jgi:hypothetical protein
MKSTSHIASHAEVTECLLTGPWTVIREPHLAIPGHGGGHFVGFKVLYSGDGDTTYTTCDKLIRDMERDMTHQQAIHSKLSRKVIRIEERYAKHYTRVELFIMPELRDKPINMM